MPTPTLSPGDIVMVVNDGQNVVTVMYDSRVYRLEPSVPTPMPIEAAILWFGDSRAGETISSVRDERGIVSYIPDRESEVRRLRVKYDNQLGDERYIVNHPIVSVYSVPGNEKLPTVLDDPHGDAVLQARSTVQQDNDLRAVIERQSKQIELLMTVVNQGQMLGQQPSNPGFVQDEQGPVSVTAPSIPGIPSEPPAPLPDELASQLVNDLPQDGVPEDGEVGGGDDEVTMQDATQDLPQDGDFTPTPPPATPPSSTDPSAYGEQ